MISSRFSTYKFDAHPSIAQHTSPRLFHRSGDADKYKPSPWFCPRG
jgi:hypothetical protein